jgi:hypothetical protein
LLFCSVQVDDKVAAEAAGIDLRTCTTTEARLLAQAFTRVPPRIDHLCLCFAFCSALFLSPLSSYPTSRRPSCRLPRFPSLSFLSLPNATHQKVQAHLDDFNLAQEFGTYGRIKGLSGGQKVKLVLAAAFWTVPHVLVFPLFLSQKS